MKNIFKVLSIALLGFSFTACVGDIDTPDRGQQGNPEKEVAGTYNGTWTLTYTENGKVTEYTCDGTATIAPKGDQAYAGTVSVKAEFANNVGMSLETSSAVNISPLTNANSYQFYNSVTPNGFTKVGKEVNGTPLQQGGADLKLSTTLMGQIFPRNAEGELVKEGAAYMQMTFDFTYQYQKQIKVNNRPRNVDCKEVYKFVGVLNK